MKLIMIICPEERRNQLVALVEKHGVHSFTELAQVTGEGETGKHLGTQAWPGKSTLIFTVVTDQKKDEMVGDLKECRNRLFPGEGMKVFVMPAEEAM